MTTNRANTIDRAFQSRIHLTLRYPELDPRAREHIWRRMVGGQAAARKGESLVSDRSFGALGRLDLNGREIKNLVRIASLIAKQEGLQLVADHIVNVLRATGVLGPRDALEGVSDGLASGGSIAREDNQL